MTEKPLRVAITGFGVVSPLGFGAQATEAAFREGRDCVSKVEEFDTSKCRSSTAGRVDDAQLSAWRPSGRSARRLHRASLMMIAALRETLSSARGFQPEQVIVGTTSGGMTFGEAFYRSLPDPTKKRLRVALVANYMCQKPVLDALEANRLRAPVQLVANACASGSNAIGHAFHLVRSGQAERVLAAGYDAISELVFVGFDSLQASTAEKCRPFDKNRTGLVLGEGSAFLAMESEASAAAGGREILGYVAGYGISTDNHHLTQPHPSGDGPYAAMERALASANLRPEEIDYVNAHGTATLFNDATEGLAIERLFARVIPVSSTKGMMGHSLGAAGAIEAVIALLAIQKGYLPPNLNFTEPDDNRTYEIIANVGRPAAVQKAISNSFGFGGTNATVVLEAA